MCSQYTKVCTRCGVEQPHSSFYRDMQKSDGLQSQCKSCRIEYARRPDVAARLLEYSRTDERRAYQRERRRSDGYRERHNEYMRGYEKTAKRREYMRLYSRSSVNARAVVSVNNAVKLGKLPHVSTCRCFVCAGEAYQYHHVDYDRPLEVIPVCTVCHKDWHRAT